MKKKIAGCLLVISAIVAIGMAVYSGEYGTASTEASIDISSGQAILIDGKTGTVIYEKSADEKAYPASTTKIMTALITLETLEKFDSPVDQEVEIPESATSVEGSSIYLKPGEKITIEDLLYGLMLVSGNDCATALAIIIGGSEEEFVSMMNRRAAELGCSNSNFTNPSGLFDENHYTTARDMSRIALEAMKREDFRKIVGTESHTASRRDSEYRTFINKNKTLYQYEGGTGIKIGYTKSSGRTLVASSERAGRSLICVVMSAPNWFKDAYALMDWGFESMGV
jgi:D-alanyl-D-alanine carboxypeptidase (penicillin-binding protein 5/6)